MSQASKGSAAVVQPLTAPWLSCSINVWSSFFFFPQPQKKVVQEVPEEQVRKAKILQCLLTSQDRFWVHV